MGEETKADHRWETKTDLRSATPVDLRSRYPIGPVGPRFNGGAHLSLETAPRHRRQHPQRPLSPTVGRLAIAGNGLPTLVARGNLVRFTSPAIRTFLAVGKDVHRSLEILVTHLGPVGGNVPKAPPRSAVTDCPLVDFSVAAIADLTPIAAAILTAVRVTSSAAVEMVLDLAVVAMSVAEGMELDLDAVAMSVDEGTGLDLAAVVISGRDKRVPSIGVVSPRRNNRPF